MSEKQQKEEEEFKEEICGGWCLGPVLGNGLCGVVRKGYRIEDPVDQVYLLIDFFFFFLSTRRRDEESCFQLAHVANL